MDIPASLTALRIKAAGLAVVSIALWFLGGALPLSKPWRSASLSISLAASIAGVIASKRLILEESFFLARLAMNQEAFQSELAIQTAALEEALQAEYLGSEPVNVPNPEPLEPSSSLAVQGSEPSQNRARTEPEPSAYADPFSSEISSNVRGFVIGLKRQGLSQDAIISQVWGCKKGGSDKYKEAKKKYDAIMAELE